MNKERKVLEVISKKQLIKKDEISRIGGKEVDEHMEKSLIFLKDNGYIDTVTLGELCFVIKQKGWRALKTSNGSV